MPGLARWLLGAGIVATLTANVAHGLGHGIIDAAVAAWLAVTFVGSYELLMVIIRGGQTSAAAPPQHAGLPVIDPLGEQAVLVFAAELAADRVPSVRASPAVGHVGQPRAQRLRKYLVTAADTHGEGLAALARVEARISCYLHCASVKLLDRNHDSEGWADMQLRI